MDPDETDLVTAARAGDEDAWEVLYRRVYPRLRAYLARRLGPLDAEDAVHETMTRAVAGLDRYRVGPAGFEGWLFGIARHVSADHHRHRTRVKRRPVATAPDPQASGEPHEALVVSEEHEQVRRAFGALSADDRELLELRVVAGLSAEQVAAVLGRRPGAVRTAQSRALARLRELLENDDG